MSGFKLIAFIFPFIKEMVLGEKTVRQALKTNKMKVLILGVIMLSFLMNMMLVPKYVKLAANYVGLEKKYKALQNGPVKPPVLVPAEKPKEVPPSPAASNENKEPTVSSDTSAGGAEEDDLVEDTPKRYKPPAKHKSPPVKVKDIRPDPTNSPEAVRRYQEWKKTFDEIKAREERNAWVPPDADLSRR